jgi:hypothetical protein
MPFQNCLKRSVYLGSQDIFHAWQLKWHCAGLVVLFDAYYIAAKLFQIYLYRFWITRFDDHYDQNDGINDDNDGIRQ